MEKEIVFIKLSDKEKFNDFNKKNNHNVHLNITNKIINGENFLQIIVESLNHNKNESINYVDDLSKKLNLL